MEPEVTAECNMSASTLIAAAVSTMKRNRDDMVVIGICGPQGAGKSTATQAAARILSGQGLKVATLAIDDLYLPKAGRRDLARSIHPLFETRGPPGTHDAVLGLEIIHRLRSGSDVSIPTFDKLADDRLPCSGWTHISVPVDVLLFEGWCVGARAQPIADLAIPINELEKEEDPDLVWRQHVNAELAGAYARLFAEIDLLCLLRAPSFDIIYQWRAEQERAAFLRAGWSRASEAMDEPALRRFISHYERLTRHIDETMPTRADLTLDLNVRREVCGVHRAGSPVSR
jgi:D-glycerate 3-kinase